MSQKKAQTHLSPKKESSFSCCGVSTCLFLQLLCPFRVPLPMFTTSLSYVALSQWNLILLLYAQECFLPGEWQHKFTVLWLFLKCTSFCPGFLTVKHSMCHTKFSTHLFSWNRLQSLFSQRPWFFFIPDINWTQRIHHSVLTIITFSFWVMKGTAPAVPKLACLPYFNLELSFGCSSWNGGTDL